MVLSATFNNNSVISWRSVLLMEEIKVNREKTADLSEIRTHNVSGDRY
jgi:hypothetical protein